MRRYRIEVWAAVAPFLLLAGVSLYLLANWNSIPARFPIHWDVAGRPNGWSVRSFSGVFKPLAIAFGILAFIAATNVQARMVPGDSGRERRNRALWWIPLIVMWIGAIVSSLVALTPVILRNGRFPISISILILIPVAGVIASVWFVARAVAERGELPAGNTPEHCWKWGQFYLNPDDPSIMVEKRSGLGYTLNFAHWQSWILLGATLAAPVIVVLFARH